MSLVTALLVGVGILMWPDRYSRRRLAILPEAFGPSGLVALSVPRSAAELPGQRLSRQPLSHQRLSHQRLSRQRLSAQTPAGKRLLRHVVRRRREAGVTAAELLGLLEAIAPALEAGMSPATALRFAADSRSGSGRPDPIAELASGMASAAADGAVLGPLWREAAESADSAELLLLAHAWSLTEDMGAPLAQAVRTTAALLEARIAHQRRLTAAVAGAKATVNVLTVLPIAGPLLALVLGIGPGELYGGSRLTQGSLALGLCLAGVGRWWVHRMVRAVARGPMLA